MRIAFAVLLGCSLGWAQTAVENGTVGTEPVETPPAMAAQLDAPAADLVVRMRTAARQSDGDVVRLRIERWKIRDDSKEQAMQNASSIHRNLAYAVPKLLDEVAAQPTSLKANFALYRDLTVLYEALYSLSLAAEAYGPSREYSFLVDDLSQLNQLRRELADRVEQLSALSDAGRLRPLGQPAASAKTKKAPANSVKKIVVDDTNSNRKHSTKPAPSKK